MMDFFYVNVFIVVLKFFESFGLFEIRVLFLVYDEVIRYLEQFFYVVNSDKMYQSFVNFKRVLIGFSGVCVLLYWYNWKFGVGQLFL